MDRCAQQCCPPSLDPFCVHHPSPAQQQQCYFNPFLHAQCLGVDLNIPGLKEEIQKCQDEYKKKVWSIMMKYAVGEAGQQQKSASNADRHQKRTK